MCSPGAAEATSSGAAEPYVGSRAQMGLQNDLLEAVIDETCSWEEDAVNLLC